MNEQWKEIAGFDGRYLISTHGRVIAKGRQAGPRMTKDRIKKATSDGRPMMTLHGPDGQKRVSVRRLTLETFGPPAPVGKWYARRREGSTTDHVEDLYWASRRRGSMCVWPMAGPEQWRDIPGYELSYEISNHGHVVSKPRVAGGRTIEERDMVVHRSKGNSEQVHLSKAGSSRSFTVAALMQLAWPDIVEAR